MSQLLEALRTRQPLPRGPYPTAVWPEGCTHLQPAPKPDDASSLAALIRRSDYTPAEFAVLISAIANKLAALKTHAKAIDCLDIAADFLEAS